MDRALFLELAGRYKDTVFRIALNMLGSVQNADDIVQDALIRLLERGESFESEEHAKNWLVRVSVNLCKNVLRSPWYRRRAVLEESAALTETPEHGDLYTAIMALPEKYRTPLYLFYYEGYSAREIAGFLHISESAVTTRLSRARQMLKERLTEVS